MKVGEGGLAGDTLTLQLCLGQRMKGVDSTEENVHARVPPHSQTHAGQVPVQVSLVWGGKQLSSLGHLYWLFFDICFCFSFCFLRCL